jgi:ABC-type sugar transport system ATPase subunit
MLSIAMPIALEIRGLHKTFFAGISGCAGTARVLCDIDLILHAGEAVAVVGSTGAGKSTLMLCVAGLLRPDAGHILRFGDARRASCVRRVLYHIRRTDLMRFGATGTPVIHLLDVGDSHGLEPWIFARCAAGDAVMLASRDAQLARGCADRTFVLKAGMLLPDFPRSRRVAESA